MAQVGRHTHAALKRGRLLITALLLLLTGCLPPRLPPVVKIGLVAPFEGRYRDLGYDAIYAARLAARQLNAAGGIEGWQLELVAYDDRGAPDLAQTAARNLMVDPDVVAVIGHYRAESTAAAQPLYAETGLAHIAVGAYPPAPGAAWHLSPAPDRLEAAAREQAAQAVLWLPDTEGRYITPYPRPQDLDDAGAWIAAYVAMGPHVPAPGVYALPTYDAVYVLAQAIAANLQAEGRPTRAGILAALPGAVHEGRLGRIAWHDGRFWEAAPLYLYEVENGGVVLLNSGMHAHIPQASPRE